jgi:hypothetical protein
VEGDIVKGHNRVVAAGRSLGDDRIVAREKIGVVCG